LVVLGFSPVVNVVHAANFSSGSSLAIGPETKLFFRCTDNNPGAGGCPEEKKVLSINPGTKAISEKFTENPFSPGNGESKIHEWSLEC
jgi:hypothetical protein